MTVPQLQRSVPESRLFEDFPVSFHYRYHSYLFLHGFPSSVFVSTSTLDVSLRGLYTHRIYSTHTTMPAAIHYCARQNARTSKTGVTERWRDVYFCEKERTYSLRGGGIGIKERAEPWVTEGR
jgi:hypothetical protein